jgi:hypothetical protein
MFHRNSLPLLSSILVTGIAALGIPFLAGCGAGNIVMGGNSANDNSSAAGSYSMGGILHGGPNPIIGATITLYTTTSTGYGATANVVASTTTDSSGFFNLTLPTATVACPTGQYAYVTAYAGSTGASSNNPNSLLMVPIGACTANYTSTGSGPYVNTYTGPTLWIDELTTAVSAYALGNFMTVTNAGVVNIGAPANNFATASATTPSAAGLAHAFATATSIVNINTGQPFAYTNGGSSVTTGGVVPDGEIYLLGNILQACVNSNGTTGTNTATSNDGSYCGMLFSLTTPPKSGAAVPTNTLQAMLDLAKFPNPSISTWNSGCTASGSGTQTSTSCIFGLAAPSGAYSGAITSAPPDWALAIVYSKTYGAQTTACTGTCPGISYPLYVALDYADNVYVLNYDANAASSVPYHATTWTNIIGIANSGAPIFASAQDTTHTYISIIATDTAGHVIGPNENSTAVLAYSTTSGSLVGTGVYTNTLPLAIAVDPFNNLYVSSYNSAVNLRKFTYGGTSSAPTYAVSNVTTTGPTYPPYQIVIDSNLDLYEFEAGSLNGSPTINYACLLANENASLTTAGTYPVACASATLTGSSSAAAGIGATSSNNAFVIDSVGVTPITKSGSGASATIAAGTPVAIPADNGSLNSRFASIDGSNWLYSVDGGGGTLSGVSVYDSVDNLALGTYKGCYVSGGVCGTAALTSPMFSPRAAGIDSAGDIWVVSGSDADLTELVGAAAPTWPGLSMAKAGLPQ